MLDAIVLSHQVPEDWRAQAAIFDELFLVFIVIGTLVGIVVVSYTLWNAYRYRDGNGSPDESFNPPAVGELPSGAGGGKGKKLFLSFGISAVVVISLVVYSYMLLLYVESGPTEDIDQDADMELQVTGIQFIWQFEYPNGHESTGELRVPEGALIKLDITSTDVWHNFGVPELRIKEDAIPGQQSSTWFIATDPGTYEAKCYELCGTGHSEMLADVVVMETEDFEEWYAETEANGTQNETAASDNESAEAAAGDGMNSTESEGDGTPDGGGGASDNESAAGGMDGAQQRAKAPPTAGAV